MGRCVEAAHQDDGLPEPQRGIVERAYDDRGHELMRQAARHSPPDARQRDAYARFFVFPAARVAIDVELALQMAKSAVELEPNQAAYQQTLGVALCRAGDWQAAIAALEKSIELAPSDSAIDHFFLALAHSHLGDHDTARAWYDKGVEWGDKNPDKIDDDLRGFRAEAAEQVLRLTDKARAEPGDATPYGEAGTAVKTPDSTGK
jgi:tetratricopeptide (TPR) repeat protein